MKKIYLYGNIDFSMRKDITQILNETGIEVVSNDADADCIFSVGGDGTFLHAASTYDKPIAGIHNRTLGFLTNTTIKELPAFAKLIAGNCYLVERRETLSCFYQNSEESQEHMADAINDVVISRDSSGIIRFMLYVDNILLGFYAADGIVVSTPTGASGYGMSCGGPFVHPLCECIEVSFIAPHTIMNRSLILPTSSVIRVEIDRTRNSNPSVQIDGEVIKNNLTSQDSIIIKKSERTFRRISTGSNFLEKIKTML